MSIPNIPYQSFCWVIGTTSFRTAKLNLKIEQQLLLLSEFHEWYLSKLGLWEWNNVSQSLYYDFMQEKNFISGAAKRKDKDAREKTSGLVNIGLINADRTLTEAGNELLKIAKDGDFKEDNYFNIDIDSYVYLKQLLKTSRNVNAAVVRPYYILAKLLTELRYLTFVEFTYLLPLAIDEESTGNIIERIKDVRMQKVTIEDTIYDDLMRMENYQLAYKVFIEKPLTKKLVCSVGMNRKSRKYDEPYYKLLTEIIEVFYEGKTDRIYDLFLATKGINQRPGVLWRSLIFTTVSGNSIRKHGIKTVREDCVFKNCDSIEEIKTAFFKYMHVYKAMSTLEDYCDLNKRYFGLTDTLIFEDNTVRFDLIPKYFFDECIDTIYEEAFTESDYLKKSVSMDQISTGLKFDEVEIYSKISKDLGVLIKTPEQAKTFVQDERYRRFNQLINNKFSDPVLLELLECFESRDDARIEELVTDDADIPTIFEYVVAIIWYKVSERQGNILEYMKLSLEANLLPKTHATGGNADIVYEYEACEEYPKHSLLIEATLTSSTNQRRAEMEPVSRHLGEYLLASNNPFDYSLFISTFLHKNVVADFKSRKHVPYYGDGDEFIHGMKIISLDTKSLKEILDKEIRYKYLYKVFDKYYESEISLPEWQDNLLREATQTYERK